MSLLDDIIGELVGVSGSETVDHPCQNCPSDCALAPTACSVCKPYKEKLVDAIYRVEHIDEIRSKYVVSGVGETTSIKCPYCGATTSNLSACEYCGSALEGGTDKITVASAKDIPNPILEAQDIIFARYAAVKGSAGSSSSSDDFLSQVFSLLTDEASEESALGAKMTEAEIKEVAASYGVSVADYLSGLDNGRYLTLMGKKTASQATTASSSDTMPGNANVPGLAGMAIGALLGNAMSSSASDSWSRNSTSGNWNYRPNGSHTNVGGRQTSSSSSRDRYPGHGGMGGMGGGPRGGMGGPGGRGGMGGGPRGGMGGPGGRR